jgi:hypothetical protein
MPIVKVTGKDQSQNGKWRVYFDGKTGWSNAFYVGSKCAVPDVGMTIDANTTSTDFHGKTYWYLNSWKLVREPNSGAANHPSQDRGNGQLPVIDAPAQARNVWDIQSGDLSRYVSNIVGSAIAAGHIKRPCDVWAWARAGYVTANHLRSGDWSGLEERDPNEGQDRDQGGELADDEIPF